MMYDTDPAEYSSVAIRLPYSVRGGTELRHFLSYEFTSDFLSPSDSWSFTVDTDELSDQDRAALVIAARVEVSVGDVVQSIGYIDDLRYHGSRSGGSLLEVSGRDWLARAVDNQLDPTLVRFTDAQTLDYLLTTVFAPYGVSVLEDNNLANRNLVRGRVYGDKRSKKGKPLKRYQLHALKPYDNEGVFAFASRVSQRFGLWLWPSVDGSTLIAGKPDYEQDTSYALRHKRDSSDQHNNVLDWDVTLSRKDQPAFIVARGFGGGGADAKTSTGGLIINPNIIADSTATGRSPIDLYPTLTAVTNAPDSVQYYGDTKFLPIFDPNAGPCFLRDTESHDKDQLFAFMHRELSLRQRKVLTARYTIPGHRLNGQPVALDTLIDVDDDFTGIHQPLWVIGRRFHKAAGSSGTTTQIEAILPGAIVF